MRFWVDAFAGVLILSFLAGNTPVRADTDCWKPWDAKKSGYLRLQDFSVFRYSGYTYVAAMKKDYCDGMAVGRTKDFKNWEYLGDAVRVRPGKDDYRMVWAPHVVETGGVYYMFYTGVSVPSANQWCQKIYVASTKDPADPSSWKRCDDAKFVVNGREQSWFRPSHSGAVWTDSAWADCRDPMVMKDGKTWYMFYSGSDIDGGITGVAVAPNILGPWTDRGAVMKVGTGIPESCFVLKTPDKSFLMVFNHAGPAEVHGIKTARARSLVPVKGVPPFGDIRKLDDGSGSGTPGWAHEFLSDGKTGLLAAYLTGYWVNFRNAVLCKESFGWTVRPSGKGVSK